MKRWVTLNFGIVWFLTCVKSKVRPSPLFRSSPSPNRVRVQLEIGLGVESESKSESESWLICSKVHKKQQEESKAYFKSIASNFSPKHPHISINKRARTLDIRVIFIFTIKLQYTQKINNIWTFRANYLYPSSANKHNINVIIGFIKQFLHDKIGGEEVWTWGYEGCFQWFKPSKSVMVGPVQAGNGFRGWKQTFFVLYTICQKCLVFEIFNCFVSLHTGTGALSPCEESLRSASSPRFARLRSQLSTIELEFSDLTLCKCIQCT